MDVIVCGEWRLRCLNCISNKNNLLVLAILVSLALYKSMFHMAFWFFLCLLSITAAFATGAGFASVQVQRTALGFSL